MARTRQSWAKVTSVTVPVHFLFVQSLVLQDPALNFRSFLFFPSRLFTGRDMEVISLPNIYISGICLQCS